MKKIKILSISLLTAITFGCSDDFLEKLPEDSLVEETVFTTDKNFETYSWSFYNVFPGYDSSDWDETVDAELSGDLMVRGSGALGNSWLWQRVTVPASTSSWSGPYGYIRRANLMLGNIEGSELTDDEKRHWESIARFFRAYNHYKLLVKYGEIPYVDKVLTDADEDVLFGPKNTRDEVASKLLEDLKFAEQNIDDRAANTVGVDVVRAMISRFGLFEGTWRKYHALGGEQTYLQASADASAKLIASNPTLHSKYDELFNSESLSGVSGVLLYKTYLFGELTHILTSRHRNSAGYWDLTKKGVDLYLCKDGKNRWVSDMFDGDEDPYDEFRNRDERLYFTTVPPFKVETGGRSSEWDYTDDPADREYLDIMANLSDDLHKGTPTANWNGFVIKEEPHFRLSNNGQGFNVSYTGYRSHKYYNNLNTGIQNQDFADAPVFRMGEVLVNHAEAMFELGRFNQAVADATINKLRKRGNVADLKVASIPDDPTRDADVDAVLWEIRRERAVELMHEGFRFNDIRRWKKLQEYGAEEKLGRYVNNADYGNKLPIQGGASAGYISPYGVPPGVPDYYYLYPIPTEELVLNPQLTQNPGWPSSAEEEE
ncbi:RagB/SusD family nutrient uptake outer membrane protein [Joostella sp. CR20]|uniref:RagB/SusD family nutrient uptake outer membrane protein n=1 Tax=Joostella sp. CR20 TaxID=2804312 RepID=UPI00313ADC09